MIEAIYNHLHSPITFLWIDLLWVVFTILLLTLAILFYFLNRKAIINRAFALLLLVIAYFAIISILTISFRVWEAQFIILIMPILCYLGFTFHLFIKAVIGSKNLMERGDYGYFIVGFIFTFYTLYELLTPTAYEALRQTTSIIEHRVERAYTRHPMYILYVFYIALPIFWATYQLIKTIRTPTEEQKEILPLAKNIFWIYLSSISLALLSLSVAPILGFKQSPALG
ncbi:MAG TPA: hypothetical protein PLY93_13495, partial [Turneriella sp.]|nr:hypothetical protein [Turneriella sp.]